jgi:hypothetical protein
MRTKKKIRDEAVKAFLAKIEHAVNHRELYPFEAPPEEEWSLESIDFDVDLDFSAPLPERVASP